tara:strand:+ start:119 stop:565 length:447 start_codon:yes stop_codon:yes gene_type:complete
VKQTLILILTLILIFPAYAFAQEIPKVTDVQEGQPAPFTGTLLNSPAAAQIIADKENAKAECKLQYDYVKQREKAKCDLLLGNANTSLTAANMKYETILKIKDDEIQRLQDIALDSPNDYTIWWYAGGVVTGILVSIGIFYVAVEAQR